MSANEQINELWAKYHSEKKELQTRSVTEHNDHASAHSAATKSARVNLTSIQIEGDRNPQFLQQLTSQGRLVSLDDLFSPECPIKGPLIGGGYAEESRGGGSRLVTDGNSLSSSTSDSSSTSGNNGPVSHGTLLHAFMSWQEVKQILWDIVVRHYNVYEFAFISGLFVSEFDRTAKTVIDRNRRFCWEELELVMSQLLENLFALIEERIEKLFGKTAKL